MVCQLGKKNNNEGKFTELARMKPFQKKVEPKRKSFHKPQAQKSIKPVSFDLIWGKKRTKIEGQ